MENAKIVKPKVILINPWVRDFKCYDEWMEPLGLLWIAAILKENGIDTLLIDCLDRFDPLTERVGRENKKYAVGDYYKVELKKPKIYECIPRKYKQYGISEASFLNRLQSLQEPDAILVGSSMTYWYEGVFRVIELVRNQWKKTIIFLGGIYATLCTEHAKKYSGADEILPGRFCTNHLRRIYDALDLNRSVSSKYDRPDLWPSPDYQLMNPKQPHRAIITSLGCPYNCDYCASRRLIPHFIKRDILHVVSDILDGYKLGILNFAFYDDALLFNYKEQFGKILELLDNYKIKAYFHTPNGMHARWITNEVAENLYQAGFVTLRLGYETGDREIQKRSGGKISDERMEKALDNLHEAGYKKSQIGVYLMVGLYGESYMETEDRAKWIQAHNAKAFINFLSPIPGTKIFNELSSKFPIITREPLSHNDLFFSIYSKTISFEEMNSMKIQIRQGNN